MLPAPVASRRDRSLSTALSGVLLASIVASCPPAWATTGERPARSPIQSGFIRAAKIRRSVVRNGRALWQGTVKEGPKHTLDAITEKPVQYGALLAGIGIAGAGAKAAGIDPEPYAIGLSTATFLWSSYKALPTIAEARGPERIRRIGAHLVWPLSLVVGTTVAGTLVQHGGVDGNATPRDVAVSGAQSVIIGADSPTIAQTALGSKPKH